ncbi:MAG: hypothetical protein R3314_11400 [Longimicrobiales bacterium]|nr:hypothetical protein [Longimicrobiales bacterium]
MSSECSVNGAITTSPRPVILRAAAPVAAAAALLLAAGGAIAQEPLEPGTTIRVTTDEVRHTYDLVELRADTLMVRDPSGVQAIPLASVTRLERRTRRPYGRAILTGVFVGAGAGFFTGAAMAFEEGDDGAGCWLFCYTVEEKIGLYGSILGGAGALAGAIVGVGWATLGPYGWTPVETGRIDVRVAPGAGGVGVGVTWRF